jgi:GDP-4-dehydro-6-deoxy-D-mannose reductase
VAAPEAPLITGAAGFAGSHLIDHLLEVIPRVHAWGAPPPDRHADGRVAWTEVDVLDRHAVRAAIAAARPSAIYHCAGAANVQAAWQGSARALEVNAIGTLNVLDAVSAAGLDCPVLITGSALVYRHSTDALTEEAPLAPAGPYAVSKLAQEMIAQRTGTAPVLLARSFNHAGPRQSDAYVTSSFARQIAEIEAGIREPVIKVGNLDSRRDLTDVRDVVRAYRLMVEKGVSRRPYNVCSGVAHKVRDVLDWLVARSRVPVDVEVDPSRLRPSDNPIVLGSYRRLEAETGWRPEIPIEKTLTDLLDYWRGEIAPPATSL